MGDFSREPPKAHLIQQDYAGSAGIIKDQAGLSPTADSFAALLGALK